MTYLPEISWLCKVIRSKLLDNFRYEVTVQSINPNDPGKNTVTIGDWLVDYKGNIFQVETLAQKDGDGTISFTVYDINEQSLGSSGRVAPLMGFNAYVYRASQGGFLLSQARKGILSKAAEDRIEQMENDVIWRYRGLEVEGWYPDYDDESDSDDDIHTETNITKLTLSSDFAMDEEEDGWQGGKGFRLSLATDNFMSYWHNIASAARLFGGEITSNGDGKVHIDAGAGIVKLDEATPQDIPTAINQGQGSQVVYAEWDEVASLELSDNAYNYIYYCADDDEVKTTTDFYSISFTRDFTIGRAYRYGTTVVVRLCGTNAWNFNRRVQLFGEEYFDVVRAKGMLIGETGTRNITVTAGILWAELVNRFPTDAFDSSAADTFTYWYRDGLGGWTSVATQTQIDNTYWDDGTGILNDLTSNRYGVHWVYMVHDSSVHVVYGWGNYTLAQAELATPPSSLPGVLASYATLIGKCIIKQGEDTFTELLTPFEDVFNPSIVTYHNDLSGLQGTGLGTVPSYYHLDEYEYGSIWYDVANPPAVPDTRDIRRDSNVGIGIDPLYKFHLDGTSRLTGLAIFDTGIVPDANDGAYLGTSSLGFSDLFLASGGVVNWDNGDVTLTHSSNVLSLAGGYLEMENLSSASYGVVRANMNGRLVKLDEEGDTSKYLRSDGIWATVVTSSGSFLDAVIAMQYDDTLDPSTTVGARYILLDTSNIHTNFKGSYADIATWLSTEGVEDNDIVESDGTNFIVAFNASAAMQPVTVTVGTDKNGASNHQWTYDVTDDNWVDRGESTDHNSLGGLNAGDYQHLTMAEYENFDELTDGSETALHTHAVSAITSGILEVIRGGTGRNTSTTAYGLLAAGTTVTGAHQTLPAGLTTQILVGGGASALPAWGTNIPTAVTIGSAYIYRAGGTDIPVSDGGTGQSTLTANKVLVGNGISGILSPTNLHWDNTNYRLGILSTSPSKHLHIKGGGNTVTIRLEEDVNSHYWDIINTSDDGYFQLSRNDSVKLQLDDNGKLCLGTTTSRQIITLGTTSSSSTATPQSIDMGGTFSNSAGTHLKLLLYNDGTYEGGLGISSGQIDYKIWNSYSSHVFYQGTTELMRIKGDGTIGINDPTPSYKLDVNGTGRFTTSLTVGNLTAGYVKTSSTGLMSTESITYAALTSNSNATWDCSGGLNKTWAINSDYTLSLTNVTNGMSGDCRIVVTGTCDVTIGSISGYTRRYINDSNFVFTSNVIELEAGVYHLCFVAGADWIEFNIADYVT